MKEPNTELAAVSARAVQYAQNHTADFLKLAATREARHFAHRSSFEGVGFIGRGCLARFAGAHPGDLAPTDTGRVIVNPNADQDTHAFYMRGGGIITPKMMTEGLASGHLVREVR